MFENIQQKRPFKPINIVETIVYWQGGLMFTIDRIPKKVKDFFRPLKPHFTEPAWGHF